MLKWNASGVSMPKLKVVCDSVNKTTFEAFPYEATFHPIDEKNFRGGERTRIVIKSNRPSKYEPGDKFTIEVKEAK